LSNSPNIETISLSSHSIFHFNLLSFSNPTSLPYTKMLNFPSLTAYNSIPSRQMIQAEIGGHPPIPLTQNRGFHIGSFSTAFRVLNFRGRFEALNDVFFGLLGLIDYPSDWAIQNFFFSARPFQRAIVCLKQRLYAKFTTPGS
jgi:hypothetical protein